MSSGRRDNPHMPSPRTRGIAVFIGRRVPGLLACAAAALVIVGVAGADYSVTFPDRVGDAGSSLDITGLRVSEAEGYLFFTVTFADNFLCRGETGDLGSVVAIDTDQNPDTGSAFYGTEFELSFDNSAQDAELLRAHGWDFKAAPLPANGTGWGCGPTGEAYQLRASDLGLAPNAGFNVVAAVLSPHTDTAPDIRTFNFQPVPGRLPPPLGQDARAPHVLALPSSGTHGKVAELDYWALDGRGKTADTIRIYGRQRLLKTIRRALHDSNPFDLSHLAWRVPRNLRGRLRFSARSADAAGNRSSLSWTELTIR